MSEIKSSEYNVLQVAIDGCKRLYAVDANDEIKRIRAQKCMSKTKDYPRFMKFTHKIPVTKNGNDRPYKDIVVDKRKLEKRIDKDIICPMNWMQERLDKIQGASTEVCIESRKYLVERAGSYVNTRQMNKIRAIVEEFDAFVAYYMATNSSDGGDDYDSNILEDKSEEVYSIVSKMKIKPATMHRLIESALGYDDSVRKDRKYEKASRYAMRTLNVLYHANKPVFLQCFVPKKCSTS